MLKASMACSSWPVTRGWDCVNGGIWTQLDGSMNISQTSECESLCYKRNTNGCCALDPSTGCNWKDFATAINVGGNFGIAISCNFSGSSLKTTDLD